jgi:hypothetical protein
MVARMSPNRTRRVMRPIIWAGALAVAALAGFFVSPKLAG